MPYEGKIKLKNLHFDLRPFQVTIGKTSKQFSLEEEVEVLEERAIIPGTGIREYFVRTEDGEVLKIALESKYIVVRHIPDYYESKKSYARRAGEASRKYGIPFDVCLAVGADGAELLAAATIDRKKVFENDWELTACGIDRRKKAIRNILGDELTDRLNVDQMGQENSKRLARWLSGLVEPATIL